MEDDQPSPLGVEGSAMEEKPLGAVELTNSEQCEFVPELGDSQMLGAKLPVEAKEDEPVAEEELFAVDSGMRADTEGICVAEVGESTLAGAKPLISVAEEVHISMAGTTMEAKIEAERVESGVGKSVAEMADSLVVSDVSPIETKYAEALAEEQVPAAGIEMEMKSKVEQLETGLEKPNPELDDSHLARANSPSAINDGGARQISTVGLEAEMKCEGAIPRLVSRSDDSLVAGVNLPSEAMDGGGVAEGEILTAVTEMEMKCEVKGGASKWVSGLDDSQLVGVKLPIVEEISKSGSEMDEFEGIASGGEKFLSEVEDAPLLGAASYNAVNEDEEVMAEGETGTEDMENGAEAANEVGTESVPHLDDLHNVNAKSPNSGRDEDGGVVAEDDRILLADTEMETGTDVIEMVEAEKGVHVGGKRKRGRIPKVPARAPARKVIGEDVCFICFDGGDLVLCDRRGCTKAYHPSCVNRDEAFFRAKGRWNCGWHLCSICQKNAHYMCYTCTFSLCKACIKDAVILCVRGNRGFCETCIKTVILIENNDQANKEDRVDFDDKSSWEYLFKDYWMDLKARFSLSSVEVLQAKNPWKGSDMLAGKQENPEEVFDANNDQGSASDGSENREAGKQNRRKAKKRSRALTKEKDLPSSTAAIGAEGNSVPGDIEWASKELLEFVMLMKNGDKSALSQFDVQALLLEYIKRNKLRDPRRKSQIICDSRLENLFGKACVGHFEMLKLLESHFLMKEDSQTDDVQGVVVDTEFNDLEADGNIDAPLKGSNDRRHKTCKKGGERGPQSNLGDYAAIDLHNINLIYLRRKLLEDLLEDAEKFHDKVVGTFVRIRISSSNQKQEIYRLVQVVGIKKAAEPYKVGKKMADIVLEILNLNKAEDVSIDTISNQEFTEDECKRLQQSIKCGLINRLTVGEILDKAMEVQAARVNYWLESETVRLCHLRDRASEKGRRKELRECVEKLKLLKTPEEHRRRLEEIPEVHADPNMDPSYESEDDDCEMEDNKQETYPRTSGSVFNRKGREPISPRRGSFYSTDTWNGTTKGSGKNLELTLKLSNKDKLNEGEGDALVGEIQQNQVRDTHTERASDLEKVNSATNSDTTGWNNNSIVRSASFSGALSETSESSLAAGLVEAATKINEAEKMWHYQDPSGKVQGPFSIVQLRKWNNTGYFPVDLRIWRTTDKQDNSVLLTDALAGKFHTEVPLLANNLLGLQTVDSPQILSIHAGKPSGASLQEEKESQIGERLKFDQSNGPQNVNSNLDPSIQLSEENLRSLPEENSSIGLATPPVEVPKLSSDGSSLSLPSSKQLSPPSSKPKTSTSGLTGGQGSESKLSSSSFPLHQVGSVVVVNSFTGSTGTMQLPAISTPDSGELTSSSISTSVNQSGRKEHNIMKTFGVSEPASVWNPGRELTRGSENDASSSLIGSSPISYSKHGITVGSTATAAPTSQTIMTTESHGMHHPVETQGWKSGSPPKQERAAPGQILGSDSEAWGGASSLKLETSSSLPVPAQPAAYSHWGGFPSTIQNPAGNFPNPGFSALPQSDPWRPPPVVGFQPNIQPAAPPSVPLGMGVAETNSFTQAPNNPYAGWGPMQVNNVGWGVPAPGTTHMNWGASVQGSVNPGWVASYGNPGVFVQGLVPSNTNPGWPAQTGNPASTFQGPPAGNEYPGWVAPTGNPGSNFQGPPPGNGHPGWVAPTGNPGSNFQWPAPPPGNVNPVWGAPPGNPGTTTVQWPGPGNANPVPAGNMGMQGSKNRPRRERFSGPRGRDSHNRDSGYGGRGHGRQWNRQSSFGGKEQVCKFYKSGDCKKGDRCCHPHE